MENSKIENMFKENQKKFALRHKEVIEIPKMNEYQEGYDKGVERTEKMLKVCLETLLGSSIHRGKKQVIRFISEIFKLEVI